MGTTYPSLETSSSARVTGPNDTRGEFRTSFPGSRFLCEDPVRTESKVLLSGSGGRSLVRPTRTSGPRLLLFSEFLSPSFGVVNHTRCVEKTFYLYFVNTKEKHTLFLPSFLSLPPSCSFVIRRPRPRGRQWYHCPPPPLPGSRPGTKASPHSTGNHLTFPVPTTVDPHPS